MGGMHTNLAKIPTPKHGTFCPDAYIHSLTDAHKNTQTQQITQTQKVGDQLNHQV